MSYRLDQYLTLAGEGSRSQVKQFLKKGLVQVDGITEKQAKRKVLGNEQITLNGKPVYYEEHCYLMLHKPAGVVTATEDKKEKTVMDLPGHSRKIAFIHMFFRGKQTVCQLSVVCDKKQSFRVFVQPSDRADP